MTEEQPTDEQPTTPNWHYLQNQQPKPPIKPPPRKQLPPLDVKDLYFIIIGIIIVLAIYAASTPWLGLTP